MSLYEMVSAENDDVKLHYFPRVRSACGRHLNLENGDKNLNFSSCDYLGMADNQLMKDAAIKAIQKYGTNISGPMIFCGYTEYHEELENRYAEMYQVNSSLMYTTSYQANIGALPIISEDVDLIVMDKLCHVSLYDAVKLSNRPFRVYQHGNISKLTDIVKNNPRKKILVVSDGLFSADGDFCDVAALCELKERYPGIVLYIDDAHGVGAFGENGCGLVEASGCMGKVDVIIGTMSKSFGSTGGFCIIKDDALAQKVRYKSATYNASRAVSPGVAAASCMALEINQREGKIRRAELAELVNYAHHRLEQTPVNKMYSVSAVIPVIFEKAGQAAAVNDYLLQNNIMTSLFVPPYVEQNKSRLRITLTRNHTKEDIDLLAEALEQAIFRIS
ncbi:MULTISPECIES: aminotransferase class I/II-fold pyridoxal phosphate-dependent enzyme [Raoultella]|uniref:aminotransferase class I/II-fold pyridoxal phosphate-dependent enzyme n=1 Tax=Raoultella TaxID=160674 RepID=UPI001556FD73|nr:MULTISPECIES: pyridoxal phosphate-dependent aminotransferase family protein [Raoultella]MCF6711042.1 pyridoxal phosphate-dependent aminotransferase family protein [Raoultella ornithinolytica]MCW9578596.1 pyridoxal phosphate-dependent aminotransferase family protein [Raoultella ornithinolytica]MDI0344257.1 pyridoxal phosphate-dependent aminotransferase family protein [Raoultella ornithinolytica]MDI0398068.1 pyridoxal phosphate-dependent aminotransferase family protein [Raoultella ornithinolyt